MLVITEVLGASEDNLFGVSYYEFKIRQGPFFPKIKVLYLNSQPTDSQSGVITITPKSELCVRDTENLSVTFSHA